MVKKTKATTVNRSFQQKSSKSIIKDVLYSKDTKFNQLKQEKMSFEITPQYKQTSEEFMQIEEILSLLSEVKSVNNGWMATCPAHSDKNPSLSISEKDGKVLLNCFAGCATESVISAIGLEMKDLFIPENNQKNKQSRMVETYDYTDENGKLLFQVVRFDPKDFRQRRPDRNGGYIWNLENTRLVLYRLPEVLASPLVYLVEGEKDVETLRKYDLPATCSPMGAGKWREEYNEFLRNKTVVILPDNDEAGRRHAVKTANSIYGIAKEIVILELPNLKAKGDVTDYFANDGSVDELIDLVGKVEAWKPDETKNNEFSIPNLLIVKSANEWLDNAKKRPIPKMLFGELWFEGELCILFSDTNLGKSSLAVQIGESISKGKNISPLKLETKPQMIFYFDFELSDKQFETRYSERSPNSDYFSNHYKFSDNFHRVEINPAVELPNGFKSLEDYLNFSIKDLMLETESKILIIDNITYLSSENEKARNALSLMKELKRLKEQLDISILVLAHTPKRDLSKPLSKNDLQGSRMLMNFCDSCFAIGESHSDKNLRYLKQIKERNTPKIYDAENVCVFQLEKPENFLQFQFLRFGRENDYLREVTKEDRENLIAKVKQLSNLGKTQREIAEELNISVGSVNSYLNS